MILSVVIPTYNRPEATHKAIESALCQTRPPDEIVVVDDASELPFQFDPAGLVNHERVRVIRLPSNSGASAARQAGVDEARGDVIAFLDSDDIWFPDKLAAQIAILDGSKRVLTAVSCGWLEGGLRSSKRIPIPGMTPKEFASGCWFAPGSTVIIPKAAFEIVGPFDSELRRLEDLEWFLRFGLLGGQLLVSPSVGASISIGRRGREATVELASSRIMARFAEKLEPSLRRRLMAYLDLERAVAARNDRRFHRMLFHLVRSFIHFPRSQLHLQRWWEEDLG